MPVDLVFTPPRRAKPPRHLVDLAPEQWRDAVVELGEKPYRAEQLARAYFTGNGTQTLPESTRAALVDGLLPQLLTPVREISCDDGATVKTLWRAHDGTLIESVTMAYPDRVTVCVSSQAGCGMACPFCATGQAGLTRNLSAGEIVDQVVRAVASVRSGSLGNPDARISNVVFMGMGEPLANPQRVLTAVGRLIDDSPRGLGLSRRRVVVSTVGVVPGIEALAASGLDVTLALSLHAPDDELRDTLVPVNTRWAVREVLATALDYAAGSNTRLSIEYALIRDVNDQPFRADLLAKLLRGKDVHVNLIPLNPTPGSQWDASPKPAEEEFVRRLREGGVVTTVRDTRGREIAGACGQLAAQG